MKFSGSGTGSLFPNTTKTTTTLSGIEKITTMSRLECKFSNSQAQASSKLVPTTKFLRNSKNKSGKREKIRRSGSIKNEPNEKENNNTKKIHLLYINIQILTIFNGINNDKADGLSYCKRQNQKTY